MQDKIKLELVTLAKLPEAAKAILRFGRENGSKVFAFYGEMGAGKTTVIKEMCRQSGSDDSFSSPTYSLVNEYSISNKPEKIYHIDLFRLKTPGEALDLGIMDYLTGENYCFIEWPELIENILPERTVKVVIQVENNMREMLIFMK